jgi:hypothetical protein
MGIITIIITSTILNSPSVVPMYPRHNLGVGVNYLDNSDGERLRFLDLQSLQFPTYKYEPQKSKEVSVYILNFLGQIIPFLQPKVDFLSDSIVDGVEAVQVNSFMQKLILDTAIYIFFIY